MERILNISFAGTSLVESEVNEKGVPYNNTTLLHSGDRRSLYLIFTQRLTKRRLMHALPLFTCVACDLALKVGLMIPTTKLAFPLFLRGQP
jgi:hypothetical protein